MSFEHVAKLAQALLYEGYLLYPYRPSAVKNRHRWMLGSLYPRRFAEDQDEGDAWSIRTECLVRGDDAAALDARARFLHLTAQGATERTVDAPARRLGRLLQESLTIPFEFAAQGAPAVCGAFDVAAERAGPGLVKVSARLQNLTPFTPDPTSERAERRDVALLAAFASTHILLGVRGGEFVSLVDPPENLREAAARCRSVGVWPVLAGDPGARDTMLAAPVILDDFPRIAPESHGDFFDATEIDELLTLRVLTLTDEEKHAMRAGDPRGRALLERTEAVADDERRRLHGTVRAPRPQAVRAAGLRPGVRVRLAPRRGGDILDLALTGRTATVVTLEEDYEGRVFVTVTVDDDPGRDLGAEGRPGHRFFFRPDEVEPLP